MDFGVDIASRGSDLPAHGQVGRSSWLWCRCCRLESAKRAMCCAEHMMGF